ncbi:hypothetical protein ARMSODRAFT_965845 [Armillaria solidipes]|uniref:Uncharacterized protein n=1 Tax=Armillaria solidipes TaxID=1076256 RepID=A0A2H3APJ1_9AGAR|nr:hypothetical protein ARMSODRAFT_965845 [Armillaria solidipes]
MRHRLSITYITLEMKVEPLSATLARSVSFVCSLSYTIISLPFPGAGKSPFSTIRSYCELLPPPTLSTSSSGTFLTTLHSCGPTIPDAGSIQTDLDSSSSRMFKFLFLCLKMHCLDHLALTTPDLGTNDILLIRAGLTQVSVPCRAESNLITTSHTKEESSTRHRGDFFSLHPRS